MIGEDYFQVRAQLGTALFSLATLARDLQAPPETMQTLQDLNNSLREPFLFVVMGEVKAGKSSVLNALFGREFCRVDVLPATDKIYVFKYGAEPQDVNINDQLTECYRPSNFLRDFNIVDTPGTNTIVADHQTITEQFLPLSDLVLFIFSVTNPWAASAWEFLHLIQKKWLKQVVFVVQQADLRSATEVEAVVKHLQQTAREKLGTSPPVFAVSAKNAFLAKTTAVDKERLLRESHFDQLEDYINQAVTHGDARLAKLRSVCQTALVVLRDLAAKAGGAFATVEKDIERLNQLEQILDERRQQSQRQVGGVMWSLSQNYERSQKSAEELLLQRLTWAQTLKLVFRKEKWHADFQESIDKNLHESLKRQIANSIELLEGDLKSVWQQLHETLLKNFSEEMQIPPSPPDFIREREALLNRIELTLMEKMSNQQIEEQMTKAFSDASSWLRVPAGVAALGGAAAIAAALAHIAIVDITGTVAGVAALFGAAVAVAKRHKIIAEFRTQMARKREEVLAPIEDHLGHAIALFYQDLAAIFQPLQTFCGAQRKIYEPIVTRAQQLEETLAKTGADLGVPRKS